MHDETSDSSNPPRLTPNSRSSDPEGLAFPDQDPTPLPPRQRGHALIAWTVVIVLTLLAALWQVLRKESPGGAAQEEQIGLVLVQMQARYIVGAAHIPLLQQSRALLYEQAKGLNTGPVLQRLCFVVLAGHLAGPEEALTQLADLDQKTTAHGIQLQASEADLERILRRLYGDHMRLWLDAPSVAPAERARLRQVLGWFGDLALVPSDVPPTWQAALTSALLPSQAGSNPVLAAVADAAWKQVEARDGAERARVLAPAEQTFLAMFGTAMFGVFGGLAGLAGLVVLLILFFMGKLRGGLACGSLHGGIYAETFALWMFVFIGLNAAVVFLPDEVPKLPAQGLTMLLSLAVLAWPVLRGIPWRQVREEIGWTAGRVPLLEPLAGIGCYGMALPVVAVGILMTLLIVAVQHLLAGGPAGGDNFGPTAGPAHPIVLAVAHADWWTRLQIILLVAVFAPLVEETMFRGVLYRHLREATYTAKPLWSVLFAATVVSFVFAVVHPQGLVAIPILMSLSYGFCLAREWRGSLVAPTVAHGINNGLLMLFLILALGR